MNYQTALEELVARLGITGASFAYWDGESTHIATVGARNSATGDPVTPDTIMLIGSITKIFNTVLMLQLVDDGLISLDDKVVDHLPELRLKDMAGLREITCRMLVNHTSGINCDALDYHGPDEERIADFIERCGDLDFLHRPGAGPSYSNAGTVIAGYLVQQLRGRSWYELVTERIFKPLGLTHAISHPVDTLHFRASIGDITNAVGELVQTTRPLLPVSFAPAGATLMMTAADLVTFARALANGGVGLNGTRILSAEMAKAMTQPTAPCPAHAGTWGLGWLLLPGDVLWHAGGGPGVQSFLHVHQPTGRAVALLTNCDRGLALTNALIDPIVESWTGIVKEAAPVLPAADLAPYLGEYGNNLMRAIIARGKDGLTLQSGTRFPLYDHGDAISPPMPLVCTGPHRFEARSDFVTEELLFTGPDAKGEFGGLFMGLRFFARDEA